MTQIKKLPKTETHEQLLEKLKALETAKNEQFSREYWELCKKYDRMHTLGQFIYAGGQTNIMLSVVPYQESVNPYKTNQDGK